MGSAEPTWVWPGPGEEPPCGAAVETQPSFVLLQLRLLSLSFSFNSPLVFVSGGGGGGGSLDAEILMRSRVLPTDSCGVFCCREINSHVFRLFMYLFKGSSKDVTRV